MNFWNTFYNLCKSIGKSPNGVAKELGIPSGTITWWKKGKVPHQSTLNILADYFNVSIGFLLGYEKENDISEQPTETEKIPQDNISEDEKLFLELFRKLSPEKRQMLIDMIKIALKD